MTDFALRLDHLCQNTGMRRKEIAKRIGVSNTTLSSYTNGRCEPSIWVLDRLANVLDVSTDELLGRKKENDHERV